MNLNNLIHEKLHKIIQNFMKVIIIMKMRCFKNNKLQEIMVLLIFKNKFKISKIN